MTDHDDRAAQAFRDALAARGIEAPAEQLDLPKPSRRRTWWVAGAAAAAVVIAAVVPVALRGDEGGEPEPAPVTTTEANAPAGTRWVSSRGIEVAVPEDWGYDYGPIRPDCIQIDNDVSKDPWARGTPTAPYVEAEAYGRGVPAIGCILEDRTGRGPKEFGDLPFELWQPHLYFASAASPVAPDDGEWTYRGWTQIRRTFGSAQVTVLSSPDDPGLAQQIIDSVGEVGIDRNGCESRSEVQAGQFVRPRLGDIPEAGFAGVIAVCDYVRGDTEAPGLIGSRQITGSEARELIRAIQEAPDQPGPDRPQQCVDDMYGDRALVLRFLPADWSARDIGYPTAYVYFDWCFGNGIFAEGGAHGLTKDNCRPLFSAAPIQMWSASSIIADVCWPPR